MKQELVATQNFQRFTALCNDLLESSYGVEMAAVTGAAGRGKSRAAEDTFANNLNTAYVLYMEDFSYVELLREITFVLGGKRPRFKQACFEIIKDELAAHRRVIMVDEADRASVKVLNGLRNIHDICKVPILLIGEDDLKRKLSQERRLISRVREILPFEPVSQPDVVLFYRKNLGFALTPENAAKLVRHSAGDFREVITDAVIAEKIMRTHELETISDAMIQEILKREVVKNTR